MRESDPLIKTLKDKKTYGGQSIICRYYVIYLMGSVLVFALGVLLPLAFVIIHASLRLRNLSNKVRKEDSF